MTIAVDTVLLPMRMTSLRALCLHMCADDSFAFTGECATGGCWLVQVSDIDLRIPENMDVFLLSRRPSQRATRYGRIRAFGNHFRVEDDSTTHLISYNSGVASVFQQPSRTAGESSVNYVGILKDVLELDYGVVHTKIILMRCEWVKSQDNRGNPTYQRDDAGFLVVNFRHKLPRMAEPFIFSS